MLGGALNTEDVSVPFLREVSMKVVEEQFSFILSMCCGWSQTYVPLEKHVVDAVKVLVGATSS